MYGGLKKAYLECELTKIKATFSNESVVSFMNSNGNRIDACVDKGLIKEIGKNRALMNIHVSQEYPDGTALIHIYKGSAAFGNPPSENQIVERERIIYEKEMEALN